MKRRPKKEISSKDFASRVTGATGRTPAIVTALAAVWLRAACGSMLHCPQAWQKVVNTGTALITFFNGAPRLESQNKDGHSVEAG